jgi:hypothetical protein
MPRSSPSPSGKFVFLLVTLLFLASAILLYASTGVIVSFGVPDATVSYVYAINASGTISGTSIDSQSVAHGFLRDASSNFTSIDEPDADTQPNRGTDVTGINDMGEVTGLYWCDDAIGTSSPCGFVRDQLGNYTSFVVSNAAATVGVSINNAGVIAGLYGIPNDTSGKQFAFIRDASGNITTFLPPNANTMNIAGINASSQIAGSYRSDIDNNFHGFVRAASGNVKTFDGPQSVQTGTAAINNNGTVVGSFYTQAGLAHGYFRDAQGNFTSFDVPVAGNQGTYAAAINAAGTIAGYYVDAKSVIHGYVRDPSGAFTLFDAPNAGTKANLGTVPNCINRTGQIAGMFYTNDGRTRDFLRK